MRNIKLTLEYDGTNYHGWQSQNNALAIQDVVAEAVFQLTGEKCDLVGCSRTDTGVHALGHVSNFLTTSKIPDDKFAYALNTKLPSDIVAINSMEVPMEFHARFHTKGKKYRYLIYNSIFPSALLRNRAYHVLKPLDVEKMNFAAQQFVGTHDFSAFMASGSEVKTTTRTIYSAKVFIREDVIEYEVEGNGFLYNMVRIMAGTLTEIGFGRLSTKNISALIEKKDRKMAGKTAPAHGLYLAQVYY